MGGGVIAAHSWLNDVLAEIGLVAMYVASFLEGAGFPLPYEVVFLAYGLLVEVGELSPVVGFLGLLAATTSGNVAGYWVGRLFGRRLIPWLLRRSVPLRNFWRGSRARLRFNLLPTLIAMRWIGFGFGPAIWIAGLRRTPFVWFLLVMLLVNTVWAIVWSLLAQTIVDLLANFRNSVIFVVAVVILTITLLWARSHWRRRRSEQL